MCLVATWLTRAARWSGLGWLSVPAALLLLNVSLTFANIWPTPGIRLTAELSLEAWGAVLLMTLARRWFDGPWPRVASVGGGFWLALVVGRYVEVTSRALYGRDPNLYWDLRHLPSVGAMFAEVADPWLKAGVVLAAVTGPVLAYLLFRRAWITLVEAARTPRLRDGIAVVAALMVSAGLVARVGGAEVGIGVAEPVAPVLARELTELAYEASGTGLRDLGPAPRLDSDLSRLDGADVFLFFLESYGAVSWERQAFAEALAPRRAVLAADIGETGRSVVSAYVDSTTFGGESWLAHISLLSGTEVRDQSTNTRLMAQERDTMVKLFGRRGYRTTAIMPGMLVGWPEGAFYGFDRIYDHDAIDYRGPPFGWWSVNDQFALARVDEAEIAAWPRPPVFTFFATITTHAPFVPTPPFQPDWARVLSDEPYDAADLDAAWSAWPNWLDLGPSYLTAMDYAFANVGGYLRLRADRELVMVLVGDHQPPALVSGEAATWAVPVHVIADRPAVLDRLVTRHGFAEGLVPSNGVVAQMDTLLPILLDAFGDPVP